ncbi:MAG TPA: GDSL-type esterase/lipase family protein [Candidatus Paceibacterota bacterium]
MKPTILLFGDSITRGAFDTEQGGWGDRLKAVANRKSVENKLQPVVGVLNLGIGGNTSADLVKRFRFETEQRAVKGSTFFVFSFGTNDAAVIASTKAFAVDKDSYIKNMKRAISEARAFSQEILCLTSAPVNEAITKNTSLIGKSRINADIDAYNAALVELCESEGIDYLDINALFKREGDYSRLLFADGLHPVSEGHVLIFDAVRKYYENKGIL